MIPLIIKFHGWHITTSLSDSHVLFSSLELAADSLALFHSLKLPESLPTVFSGLPGLTPWTALGAPARPRGWQTVHSPPRSVGPAEAAGGDPMPGSGPGSSPVAPPCRPWGGPASSQDSTRGGRILCRFPWTYDPSAPALTKASRTQVTGTAEPEWLTGA